MFLKTIIGIINFYNPIQNLQIPLILYFKQSQTNFQQNTTIKEYALLRYKIFTSEDRK